ncbi:mitochondrial resolvase Ydc2 [Phaeosphaeriaceae sp. PMI808]|nr:mitochondrial resolvase Ydc2 [Phaeosphaeriaceae sp. PMI808]
MVPKSRPVTAKALQALLTRIGSASSGTKNVLRERFQRDVVRPRLFALRPERQARQSKSSDRKLRIISIDMGIKNLAYCAAEVDYPGGDAMNPTMDIIRWDKIDLVGATQGLRGHLPNPKLIKEGPADADEEADPYSLSVLSETAYYFIKNQVLELSPDAILIERQRWRSASSSAIQQWTVRVNTLEAMLWAILRTLRTEYMAALPKRKATDTASNYEIDGVDPKRVGQFWIRQHEIAAAESKGKVPSLGLEEVDQAGKKVPRSKAEKRAKIALVRSWMSTEPASTALSTPTSAPKISFTIGPKAIAARNALCFPTSARGKKAKGSDAMEKDVGSDSKGREIKKLDDITDCCLQAAAWVAWESNRLQLYDVWNQRQGSNGSMPGLDEDILREMVEVAGEG